MSSLVKKVLYINLSDKTYETKSHSDLSEYIGGVGLGLKLLTNNLDKDPVIFSVGPLNGFFPFVSKTSVVFTKESVIEDVYLGGSLSFRIKFSGVDAIVFFGKLKDPGVVHINNGEVSFEELDIDVGKLGLPGKNSILSLEKKGLYLDSYFRAPDKFLEETFVKKNLKSVVFTGSKSFDIKNPRKYEELYTKILESVGDIVVESDQNPSCSGCPLGCSKSLFGEIGGNVLVHSLVACTHAEKIYSDVGTVFSCLNVLGYEYTHEDVEILPQLVSEILEEHG